MQHNIFFTSILLGLSVLVFAGCKNPDARFVKVEGTITYNGQTVGGANVAFTPVGGDGEPAAGKTDASGKYTLTSGGAKSGGTGVLPGEYSVRVWKTESTETQDPDTAAYERGEITYDELQSRRGGGGSSSSVATQITRKDLLPPKYSKPSTTDLKATVVQGGVSKQDFDLKD